MNKKQLKDLTKEFIKFSGADKGVSNTVFILETSTTDNSDVNHYILETTFSDFDSTKKAIRHSLKKTVNLIKTVAKHGVHTDFRVYFEHNMTNIDDLYDEFLDAKNIEESLEITDRFLIGFDGIVDINQAFVSFQSHSDKSAELMSDLIMKELSLTKQKKDDIIIV